MRRFLIFLHFIFASALSLHSADFRFTRLGVLQGLSSNNVGAIFTDSRGFTWIGTSSGLNRFDGEAFTLYNHRRNDSTSIPGDNVRSILEDESGMLWVGTEYGIARFNPWNGKAETIKEILPDGKTATDRASFIYIDHNKTIWARSIGELWKYNEKKNAFELVLSCDGKNNHPKNCTCIYEDKENRFWIGAYNGLFLFDKNSGALTQYELKDEKNIDVIITSILEDRDGNFWCGTWGMGIAEFFLNPGKFSTYRWFPNVDNPSAANIVFGIQEIISGNNSSIWFATNHGLATITDKKILDNETVIFTVNDPANTESIGSDQVNCLDVNSYGQLWAGTGDGISVLLPEHQLFQSYSKNFRGQTMHIVPDGKNGNYFCTWYGNGLEEIDSNATIVRTWKKIPENASAIDNGQVSDIVVAKDKTLWVATFGGLSHGDANGNNFKLFLPLPDNTNSICDKRITCVTEDHDGNIWCGSYGKGISKIDVKTDSFTNYNNANSGLAHDLVWSLYCAKNGDIWAGTNNGISRFNKTKNKFESWQFVKVGNDSILTGLCQNFFEDSRGILWIGSDNGLFFRKPDGNFGAYSKDDGLVDNAIRGIREDEDGNIWITTSNGLSKLNYQKGIFTNYSVGSGLPTPSLDGDLSKGQNGKFLIGLNNFIVSFDPEKLNISPPVPSVFITAVSVAGNTLSFSENPSSVSTMEFPWNKNVISFDFVSPGFRGDPVVKYTYQLIGADGNWVNADARHFASYGGLPPGNYQFLCRASVSNGAWSKPAVFSFIIHPPIWKTWWFIICVFTISVLLIVIVARREATQKIRRQMLVLEKQQAVEKERNRISRDMHDDLGSGLTKIAILSEVVKKKMKAEDDSQKQIKIISESARELVDNLNEIIWALNPENDNISNLAAYIREYADNFLEHSDISLHCTIPEQLPALHLSEEKRRNLFLVIKEALHNIVKHAAAKKVEINFSVEGNKLKIEVKDDGKGFDQNMARRFGNGLKSMQQRAAGIDALLKMESEEGKGTTITIFLNATS